MANELETKQQSPITIRQYMAAPEVQKRIKEMLDDRASEFTTSVISIAGNERSDYDYRGIHMYPLQDVLSPFKTRDYSGEE